MDLTTFEKEIVITGIPYPYDIDTDAFVWEELILSDHTLKNEAVPTVAINGGNYIPKPKDRIYFFPGTEVPRHKVRAWGKKNDASVTIKTSSGTAFFASSESLRQCFSDESYCVITKEGFLDWLECNYDMNEANAIQIQTLVENSTRDYVYLDSTFISYRGKEFTGCTGRNYQMNADGTWNYSAYANYADNFTKPMYESDPQFETGKGIRTVNGLFR